MPPSTQRRPSPAASARPSPLPPAVCRKAQLLNLDRLQVDAPLDAFVRRLEREGSATEAAEPMAVDDDIAAPAAAAAEAAAAAAGCSTPVAAPAAAPALHSPGPAEPPSSEAPALLKAEAMDAVVEYLHHEHRALEAERRAQQARQAQQQQPQQQGQAAGAAPVPAAPQLQRAASQPLAIGGGRGAAAEAMEVEPSAPSVRSSLLGEACGEAAPPRRRPAVAAALPAPRPAPAPRLAVGAAAPEVVLEQRAPASGEPPLLPPQRPEDQVRAGSGWLGAASARRGQRLYMLARVASTQPCSASLCSRSWRARLARSHAASLTLFSLVRCRASSQCAWTWMARWFPPSRPR